MPNLQEIKDQLKEQLLSGDLGDALTAIRAAIRTDSSHYNTFIILSGQYNSTNDRLRKMLISPADADPVFARIRNSVAEIVDDLDGKDLKNSAEPVTPGPISPAHRPKSAEEPLDVFISYAHEDEAYKDRLKDELIVLERTKQVKVWDDRSMMVSMDWNQTILDRLHQSDIICLLVTKDFVKSDYCWSKEMEMGLARHDRGEAFIVPIIIKKVPHFGDLPFARLVAVPKDAKPVEEWEKPDQAWENIGEEIGRLVKHLRQKA